MGAAACMKVLIGSSPPQLNIGVPSQMAINTANNVIKSHSKYWKSLGYAYQDFTFKGIRKVDLTLVIIHHWSNNLEELGYLNRVPMTNALLRKFERHVHISQEALNNPDVLIFSIHSEGYMRTTETLCTNSIKASSTNLVIFVYVFINNNSHFLLPTTC